MRTEQFMGLITASVTHEMQNVLATIRESAGLMGDLLSLPGDACAKHQDKFRKVTSMIDEQVERGMRLSDALNRFAHAADDEPRSTDAAQALETVLFLARRLSSRKGVRFEAAPPSGTAVCGLSPLEFMLLVFEVMEFLLERLASRTVVYMSAAKALGGTAVVFTGQGVAGVGQDAGFAAFNASLDRAQAELFADAAAGMLVLALPPERPAAGGGALPSSA